MITIKQTIKVVKAQLLCLYLWEQKFFGIIRQVAGPNDHPSCPSFLQLYRMLSVFSLFKPPKSGNCMIFEDNAPIITIADLKEITKDPAKKLKEKLNTISEEGCWDVDDIFLDHDYSDSTVFDCVVYYLAGYYIHLQII
ncbi:Uncharacterized protein FWK35_00011458 [Aphis craccivora]|uniref:Transposable element P transposase-like RNase H C-terminal domain-containing protein n=1 Tax=Aphis craccivora TaxID=307492 RepID=A0A6G0YHT8_APHCR|nr:Uncharacterized protein FWK35_00011458 [Aphis craccivora]